MQTCRKCGRELPIDSFYRVKEGGHRKQCKDCCNEVRRASWQKTYPEQRDSILAMQKAKRDANPAARRNYINNYRRVNQERVRAERTRESAERRIRVKLASIAKFTPGQLRERLSVFGGTCAYCGANSPTHIDHVKPLSRGGAHCLSNLRPACPTCNMRKYVYAAPKRHVEPLPLP